MTDDVEVPGVVCMRVDQPGIYVVPGSVQAPCYRCQNQVWVAPSTFKMMSDGHPHVLVCMRCIDDDELGAVGQAVLRGMAPEQADEIREHHDDIERHFRG